MAEIDVKIKGDDADLKRKFKESAEEAREFGEKIKEQFDQAKDVAADFAGELGLGKIAKQFASGLAVAAFGTAVTGMFKDAVSEAAKFETQVKQLGLALGPARAGMAKDLAQWVESISGHMGGIEENMKVFQEISRILKDPELAKIMVINIQNAAKQLGVTVEQLGDAVIEMKALGEISGRVFKEMPGLADVTKQFLGPAPRPKPGEPAVPEEEGLAARVKAAGGVDWFLRTVLPNIAPGGLTAAIRQPTTAAEKWADLDVEFTKLKEEVGTELLPTMKDLADYLKANLPAIKEMLTGFAKGLEDALQAIGKIGKGAGDVLGPLLHPATTEEIRAQREKPADISWMKTAWDEMVREFGEATKAHQQNAVYMHQALRPE